MAMGWSRRLPYEWRTMLERASSTARVIDLHCISGNPKVLLSRSTVPRTTESHLGLLYSASINTNPPSLPGFRSCPSLPVGRGKVFIRDAAGLLCKIVGGPEIPSEETNLSRDILFEERPSFRIRELTMNTDGGCAGHRGYLASLLASRFETAYRAVKDYEVGRTRGIAVAFAINVLKSALLKLPDEVLVKCNLEFRRNR